jgi:Replication initiator protein A
MPPRKTLSQRELLQPIVDVDLIRDERHLDDLGLFISDIPRGKRLSSRTFQSHIKRDGRRESVTIEIRGSGELGLLYSADRDKWKALLKIIGEESARLGHVPKKISFSAYRLCKLLEINVSGPNYDDIAMWVERMAGVSIVTKKIVYLAARKQYNAGDLRLFKFQRRGASDHDGSARTEQFEIELDDWIVENINLGYIFQEDFSAYKRLKRPIAKGIFGKLYRWFSVSTMPYVIEKDYQELCSFFEITAYEHKSKIKEKFGPPLDELKKIKYLKDWDVQRMSTKDGFKIVMCAGEELLRVLEMTGSRSKEQRLPAVAGGPVKELTDEQKGAMDALVEQGISLSKAKSLAEAYGPDHILNQIDYGLSIVNEDRSNRKKIANPAGFIIHQIENNASVPLDFVTSRKRKVLEAEAAEKNAEAERGAEEYRHFLRWKEDQVNIELNARYTTQAALDEVINTIIQTKVLQYEHGAREWSPNMRKGAAMSRLRNEIENDLILPGLAEWREQHPQGELF